MVHHEEMFDPLLQCEVSVENMLASWKGAGWTLFTRLD